MKIFFNLTKLNQIIKSYIYEKMENIIRKAKKLGLKFEPQRESFWSRGEYFRQIDFGNQGDEEETVKLDNVVEIAGIYIKKAM